ncbi:MAG: hydrogenase expression/formation protein HypE [Candidatus Anammoximicrobium sp.]|mgnify:CR=1 FL=1|nr:hydrogenase expression/formation protein HypE [Candidatus Anammoximicrobium sp.]
MSCPAPLSRYDTVQLAHGGGGRLMRSLIEGLLLPQFARSADAAGTRRLPPHDSAVLDLGGGQRLAFTTDSFVVQPWRFPGGDIGKLAVCGTVNDLAMAGAVPRFLSCGLILEEGLPFDTLRQVIASMQQAAEDAGVQIVTGDTKVVDRGKGDGIFVNTAGIGVIPAGIDVSPARVCVGDKILVSGDLGRHGIAIMSVREGLEFEGAPESDCAPLAGLVGQLTALGADLHCLRDLTRGGLAAAVIEIAEDARVGIELNDLAIPVLPAVRGACELLGLDPLYVANEGRLVAFVPAAAADHALHLMQQHPAADQPALIGSVTAEHPGGVELRSAFGSGRLLDLLSGEQMPRIC